jgi:hypothetical protein
VKVFYVLYAVGFQGFPNYFLSSEVLHSVHPGKATHSRSRIASQGYMRPRVSEGSRKHGHGHGHGHSHSHTGGVIMLTTEVSWKDGPKKV